MHNDGTDINSDAHAHGGGGHESSELRIAPVVWFLVGLAASTIVICLLVVGIFDALKNREEKSGKRSSSLVGEREKLPPEPRLQLAPSSLDQIEDKRPPNLKQDHPLQEMKRSRAEEDAALNGYGWVDEKAGIARIPIEQAKKILVQRGLATRESKK